MSTGVGCMFVNLALVLVLFLCFKIADGSFRLMYGGAISTVRYGHSVHEYIELLMGAIGCISSLAITIKVLSKWLPI